MNDASTVLILMLKHQIAHRKRSMLLGVADAQPDARPSTHIANENQRPEMAAPAQVGRCKGRGIRVAGRHVVTGQTHLISPTRGISSPHGRKSLPRIDQGSIVIVPLLTVDLLDALRSAGGLVTGSIDLQGTAVAFALQHRIPLVMNIPNAGQFVQGEYISLYGDGRVTVVE